MAGPELSTSHAISLNSKVWYSLLLIPFHRRGIWVIRTHLDSRECTIKVLSDSPRSVAVVSLPCVSLNYLLPIIVSIFISALHSNVTVTELAHSWMSVTDQSISGPQSLRIFIIWSWAGKLEASWYPMACPPCNISSCYCEKSINVLKSV